MSLKILLKDEFQGFYKTKLMLTLWIGFPIITIIMHFIQPEIEEIPLTLMMSMIFAAIGGSLGAVLIGSSIVSEKNKNVYDLFLIRPIKKSYILIAKILALYVCIIIAVVLCLLLGLLIDFLQFDMSIETLLGFVWESLVLSLLGIGFSCSIGLLMGVLGNSVSVVAALTLYIGNQITAVVILIPTMLIQSEFAILYTTLITLPLIIMVVCLSLYIFVHKQS